MILEFDSKAKYLSAIEALPLKDEYTQNDLLTDDLRVYSDGKVEVYYTPFDYIKDEGRLTLIGITPGWGQMELAVRIFRRGA